MAPGQTSYDSSPTNNSDDDDFFSNNVNNDGYLRYMSENNGTTTKDVAIISTIASIFSLLCLSSVIYRVCVYNANPPVKIPEKESDNDLTFIIFSGVISLILWLGAFFTYRKYKSTVGSIERSPSGTVDFGVVPWQEEYGGLPTQQDAYSNTGEVITTGFFLLISVLMLGVAVSSYIYPIMSSGPNGGAPDSTGAIIFIVFGLIFCIVTGHLFTKAVSKFMYYRRFSHAPLYTGVYSNGH